MSRFFSDNPRIGFYIVVVSYLAVGGFLMWGAQRPRLDAAFEILGRRERDNFSGYSEEDVKLLLTVLSNHSGFSRALVGRTTAKFLEPKVEGWLIAPRAHLAVKPEKGTPTKLLLESRGDEKDYPATMVIKGPGVNKKLTVESSKPLSFEFSAAEVSKPTILEFEVTTASGHRLSPVWGLRIMAPTLSNRELP
jgi:hypothetical protein